MVSAVDDAMYPDQVPKFIRLNKISVLFLKPDPREHGPGGASYSARAMHYRHTGIELESVLATTSTATTTDTNGANSTLDAAFDNLSIRNFDDHDADYYDESNPQQRVVEVGAKRRDVSNRSGGCSNRTKCN